MPYDRFMIAPYDVGLKNDVKPFALPEQAFTEMNNAYVWRGRVKKRVGSHVMNETVDISLQQQYTRLRIAIPGGAGIGMTNGIGIADGFAPNGAVLAGFTSIVGAMFSIGATYYTVTTAGPGDMAMVSTDGSVGNFDTTTGHFQFVVPLINFNTQIYFYPTLPVMGFATYQQAQINDNSTYAFDTHFAYQYATATGWTRLGGAPGYWTGTDTQYFWSTSWRALLDSSDTLFVTNFNAADYIKYWDGAGLAWHNLEPQIDATHYLNTCRTLIVFQGRMVALNTVEGTKVMGADVNLSYVNRARWSQWGDPTDPVNSWREDISGKGNALDIPSKDPIITATIIKDRLIVYCDASTWELVSLDNAVFPFKWQQINSELGAQSTFSAVNFDRNILAIGQSGIHQCNGVAVERIDSDIPDEVFQMFNTETGTKRTCAVRDFSNEMIYWSVTKEPDIVFGTSTFPNKILAYNYKNNSWAYFDDTVTAYGYFEKQNAIVWNAVTDTWESYGDTWAGGQLQNHPKLVITGNHRGWTAILDAGYAQNCMSLSIDSLNTATLTITSIAHNLPLISYVYIQNCQGQTYFNNAIYKVFALTADTLRIDLPLGTIVPPAVYTSGGTMQRVSKVDFSTKPFNLYIKQNRNTSIAKVDFLVNSSEFGEIAVECHPSYSPYDLVEEARTNGCLIGTSILELEPYVTVPLEGHQEMFWHPLYFNAEGESVQFQLYYSQAEMLDYKIAFAGFELQAMTIYAMPTSYHML